jgi:hypothetical protein
MPVYACAIKHTMSGQEVINVIGFARQDTLGAETGTEAAIVANQVAIAWKQKVLAQLSDQLRFEVVEARGMVVREVSGLSIEPAANGSQGLPSLPTFVAARVVMTTNTPGRAGRGRTGLSGIAESLSEAGLPNTLSAAARNLLQGGYTDFITQLGALLPAIFPVVISRYKGTNPDGSPIPRPGGPIASAVTSSTVQSTLGSRVSRLR